MYIAQKECSLGYMGFVTEQNRNPHDYLDDFKSEVDCFLKTDLLIDVLESSETKKLSKIYKEISVAGICSSKEVELAEIFEESINSKLNKISL
jgi:uncharacterized SAM-dependent methyltransferase